MSAVKEPKKPSAPNYRAFDTISLPAMSIDERYELIEEVGRGGMGSVFRARDNQLDREIALKQLRVDDSGTVRSLTPEDTVMFTKRFLREAKVTAQLDHPNIIPVYEIAERNGGDIFYTMQFVRGVSMAAR
ncbi:MAG: hypothetical protein KDB07_07955, partial [Planctomycetes bacterium]|nr:hypothetical protein [Planctomycetota bacterium]